MGWSFEGADLIPNFFLLWSVYYIHVVVEISVSCFPIGS
jgi:hypothetical protein